MVLPLNSRKWGTRAAFVGPAAPRNSAATRSNGTWSSSARAFRWVMVVASIRLRKVHLDPNERKRAERSKAVEIAG